MNLLDIRKLFIQHSGRHDLVVDTSGYADNGANFFINAGLRILDDMVEVTKNDSVREIAVAQGESFVTMSLARAPHKVRIVDSEGNSKFLEILTFYDFRRKYEENTDEGTPACYAIMPIRNNGLTAEEAAQKAIVLGPTPDNAYTLYVTGSFYSDPLVSNDSVNFWSAEYPHTLVQAALYSMERFYRNTQGMNDHLIAIQRDVAGIDHEDVAEAIRYRSNMADSFNERQGKYPRNYGIG